MEQIIKISAFIIDSFVHIWPYLVITIPLAVVVQQSGAAKYINTVLSKNPYASIILATIVGAFSPFCSCGVIPLIASLLIGGVPLAPVMSFWIASPSMDLEIFFLSVATIGWKLSIWRLIATFIISISASFIILLATKKGFLGVDFLRKKPILSIGKIRTIVYKRIFNCMFSVYNLIASPKSRTVQLQVNSNSQNVKTNSKINCCIQVENISIGTKELKPNKIDSCNCEVVEKNKTVNRCKKLIKEIWNASFLVIKFMALAFFINALIEFYLPKDYITNYIGRENSSSVIIATIIGIPFYTSSLTALPLIGGLLSMGMNQGAALSFLIAGPTTTLPALMAVWGIVKPKVFLLYLLFVLVGALVFGYLYNLIY